MIKIQSWKGGYDRNFCYLVTQGKTGILIDSFPEKAILEKAKLLEKKNKNTENLRRIIRQTEEKILSLNEQIEASTGTEREELVKKRDYELSIIEQLQNNFAENEAKLWAYNWACD